MALVEPIARRIRQTLPPCFDLDDLVSSGMVGLVQAATRFDRRPVECFPPFAVSRIHGAIIDSVRRRQYRDSTHGPLAAIAPGFQDVSGEFIHAADVPSGEDTPCRLMHDEQIVAITTAIGHLPKQEARLLRWRYLHSGIHSQQVSVASRLKMSRNTLAKLERLALTHLRIAMAGKAA